MPRVPPRRERQPPTSDRRVELDAMIRAAAERQARAAQEMSAAEEALAAAMLTGYTEGLTWGEVAESAGLRNAVAARSRAEKVMTEEEKPPSRRRGAKPGALGSEGVTVADAAAHLGVALSTVYARIDRGELQSQVDDLGRTRVLLDNE